MVFLRISKSFELYVEYSCYYFLSFHKARLAKHRHVCIWHMVNAKSILRAMSSKFLFKIIHLGILKQGSILLHCRSKLSLHVSDPSFGMSTRPSATTHCVPLVRCQTLLLSMSPLFATFIFNALVRPYFLRSDAYLWFCSWCLCLWLMGQHNHKRLFLWLPKSLADVKPYLPTSHFNQMQLCYFFMNKK